MFKKKIMLVEDQAVYRSGLKAFLSQAFDIVAEAGEGGEAVERALMYKPDVVLMDVFLPGMDGIAAAREIRQLVPATQVVILSASDGDQQVAEAIEAGVCGYLLKDDPVTMLLEAVTSAGQGQGYLSPRLAKQVLARAAQTRDILVRSTPLTNREMEVLELMVEGKRNHEIAQELRLSGHTIENHIFTICRKLGASSREHAIVYAMRKGVGCV